MQSQLSILLFLFFIICLSADSRNCFLCYSSQRLFSILFLAAHCSSLRLQIIGRGGRNETNKKSGKIIFQSLRLCIWKNNQRRRGGATRIARKPPRIECKFQLLPIICKRTNNTKNNSTTNCSYARCKPIIYCELSSPPASSSLLTHRTIIVINMYNFALLYYYWPYLFPVLFSGDNNCRRRTGRFCVTFSISIGEQSSGHQFRRNINIIVEII